ncbi:MAG: Zn-dependent hydrolase [Alphaproteobacteria bacterium]
MSQGLAIDRDRLIARLEALGEVGKLESGGNARLALSDADKDGRDLVVGWMRDAGLQITVDKIGNIVGRRAGRRDDLAPVMTGSHIDTVRAGGKYDGNLGVLAGLEVVETLNDAGLETDRPICVAIFTNEEGVRFPPDMLGSLVYVGGMALDEALATTGIDEASVGAELNRIGYAGAAEPGHTKPHAFVELHIEQGPVLAAEDVTIGAVRDLQGISWQEVTIHGQSNHAGTTPMRLRHDAGYAAAAVAVHIRKLAAEMGRGQVATTGVIELFPNIINVIASRAKLTVDLRNTDERKLRDAEKNVARFLKDLAAAEGVRIETRKLARFEPVVFDAAIADLIVGVAKELGHSRRAMTSGAGHDAQMMARICPTAMIFVPSEKGISHNPAEHTEPDDLGAGADVLLHTLLRLSDATAQGE